VTEAREHMMRLADSVRAPIEDRPGAPVRVVPPPPRPSLVAPLIGVGAGLAAMAAGTVLVLTAGQTDKTLNALGGGLVGAGAATFGVSMYVTLERHGRRSTTASVELALRF
jgi:hypothetical protein